MASVLKGKHAEEYDKRMFSGIVKRQFNRFQNRNVKAGSVLADLCCGSGVSIAFLKERCKQIYGIDASVDMIEMCKKRFAKDTHVSVYCGDAAQTNLKDNSCDYVLIRMGLHHIKNKQAVINEATRILKKGGKLLVMDKYKRFGILTYVVDIIRNWKRNAPLFGHYYCTYDYFRQMVSHLKVTEEHAQIKGVYIRSNIVLEKQ